MHYADYKTILSPHNGINVYRGCMHGCIYCDSRSTCYQMLHDFEDIEVKRDAPHILFNQLRRKRRPCMVVTGAMGDPYIPLEQELCVTRDCIEVVRKLGFGLAIQTKSANILRDLDLLAAINNKTKCVVEMTLTTYDEKLCSILEPNVSSTAERFSVLEKMKAKGIPTVVWLSPILPFINDTEENLRGLLDYCAQANIKGILCFGFGVTMRSGNREYFYSKLDRFFPGMKKKYMQSFGESYNCISPRNNRLWAIYEDFCREHNIMYLPKDVFEYINHFETSERQLSLFND